MTKNGTMAISKYYSAQVIAGQTWWLHDMKTAHHSKNISPKKHHGELVDVHYQINVQ